LVVAQPAIMLVLPFEAESIPMMHVPERAVDIDSLKDGTQRMFPLLAIIWRRSLVWMD